MSIESELKELILSRYGSIREFSQLVSMPYSTIDSILKRGIEKANITNLIKICNKLGISIDGLANNKIVYSDPIGVRKEIENKLLTYFRNTNSEGQNKILAYASDLNASGLYKRNENDEDIPILEIPVIGSTAAGTPLEYGDAIYDEYVSVQSIPMGAKFALTVKGDSMEPLILDGSIVFIKPQETVENGDIAVVEIDGAVTCKKICLTEGKKAIFKPINTKHPIIDEYNEVRIIGKVVG